MKLKLGNVIIAGVILLAVILGIILSAKTCGNKDATLEVTKTTPKVIQNTANNSYNQYIESINQFNKATSEYSSISTSYILKINEYNDKIKWYDAQVKSFTPERESWYRERADLNEQLNIANMNLEKYKKSDLNSAIEIERLNAKYATLKAKLDKVKDRKDITTTTNLTATKRADFFEMYDLWYKTLWE